MQVYQYCFWLLAFVAVLVNSRYIHSDLDDENNLEQYLDTTRFYRPNLQRYLRNLIAIDMLHGEQQDDAASFERRGKSIIKGDPREFMG